MKGWTTAVRCSAWGFLVLGWTISAGFADEPEVVYKSIVSNGPRKGSGIYRFYPDRWNLLRLRLANRSDREAVLQSSAYVGDDSSLQYGRLQWLPPQSILEVDYPFWIPSHPGSRSDSFPLSTHTFEAGRNGEHLVRDAYGKLTGADLMPLSDPVAATGIIGPAAEAPADLDTDAVRELVLACRRRGYLPPYAHELASTFLPGTVEGYAALDKLIVANDRLGDDSAAVAAIREWVAGGGSLWIMLEQVQTSTVEKLLGDACDLAEVDRVELNSFVIDQVTKKQVTPFQSAEHEVPVPFVRVTAPCATIEYAIDGWPAAFRWEYGAGRVLVTTLGARGWLRPKPKPDADPEPIDPAVDLSSSYFAPKPHPQALPEALRPVVERYVGYSIPGRPYVAGILGCFSLLLLGSAVVLGRQQRLEGMGIVAPILSLVFGGILVFVGLRERLSVAPTLVQLQVAEAIPGGEALRIQGLAGTYFPEGRAIPIQGVQTGCISPDMTGLSGMNRRLTWTDLREWRWENVQQPAGLRLADWTTSVPLSTPLIATATCDDRGIRGSLTSALKSPLEDVIILTPTGRLGATLKPTGEFTADSRDILGADQFLTAQVLSDEQRRRTQVLETLCQRSNRDSLPSGPLLVFWTSPIDGGLRIGRDLRDIGSAVVMVPLTWQRAPVGTDLMIPAPLISLRETTGPDGAVQQGLLNSRTGEWQERSSSASSWLRGQLPVELAPLELQSLNVTIRVTGQMSRLQLAGWKNGRLEVLQAWDNPAGTLRAELTDSAAIPLSADGGFLLNVSGTSDDRKTSLSGNDDRKIYWQIESFDVGIRARCIADSGGI